MQKYIKLDSNGLYDCILKHHKGDELVALKTFNRIIQSSALASILVDVADNFFVDVENYLRPYPAMVRHSQKYHLKQLQKAIKDFRYHAKEYCSLMVNSNDGEKSEDDVQDLYEIVKLISDHTDENGKGIKQIKSSIKRLKHNNHIFDDD